MPLRHICIYGLTAAGKTTHATLLAQQLHMDYVSASGLMFRKLGYRHPGDDTPWTRGMSKITALRRGGAVDEAVNQELMARAAGDMPTVFDSWTLPFMAVDSPVLSSDVLFVRLGSDIGSRAVKCVVSQGAESRSSISDAMALIKEKDALSRQQFRDTFGIDIFKSPLRVPSSNMIKLNVSQYVFGSGAGQIRHGIKSAHSRIADAINQKLPSVHKERLGVNRCISLA
jgi:cytidylate kinase